MIRNGEDTFEKEAEENSNSEMDFGERSVNPLAEKMREYTNTSPTLSGGDVDAAWEDADDVGEEAVGGGNPTPDQSVVEELGEAMGVTFQDNEPLDFTEKMEKRDRDRWELDPASAEDSGSV